MSHYDIIIVGGGVVGAVATLALAKQTALKIALLDSQPLEVSWSHEASNHRVSAISLASKHIFQNLSAWEKMLSKRVSPYKQMHIWEESGPATLDFNCEDVNTAALGYIIEDQVMRASLSETMQAGNKIDFLSAIKLTALHEHEHQIELITEDQRVFTTQLLIGADGANSWVREQAGIALKTRDYDHTALVATVKTEFSHQCTAWQRFLKTGPLAFLPLADEFSSSIVWSTIPEHADELLKMDAAEFKKNLSHALGEKLGEVTEIGERYHFPLKMRHVKQYVKPRMALIGDAAHTIHPLAGQGLNLGLLDAVSLAEIIANAHHKQRDFSSYQTLRRYERWRKGNTVAMLGMVEMLKHLFMSDKDALQRIRELGFAMTNNIYIIKNFFINYAIGRRSDLPKLARVETFPSP